MASVAPFFSFLGVEVLARSSRNLNPPLVPQEEKLKGWGTVERLHSHDAK